MDSIFGSSCWRCLVDFIWFFFYSCFEEQWLIFMIDFCRFVALLQVKLSFNLSLLLWSRPRLRSSRALCLSLALIFINSEVWRRSLMNGNLLLLL